MDFLMSRILRPHQLDAVEEFFDALELPEPEEGQVHHGTNERLLIFLNHEGLVLRITQERKLLNFDNPHFLKPLFTRHSAGLQFAIDPGIDCPVPKKAEEPIYRMLYKKYGLNVMDGKPENLGYLPGDKARFPVMIDLDAEIVVEDIESGAEFASVKQAREYLGHDGPFRSWNTNLPVPDPQHQLYGELKEMAQCAWQADTNPDFSALRDFMAACRAYKQDGKLLTRWMGHDYRGTRKAAMNYHHARFGGLTTRITQYISDCVGKPI